MDAVVLRANLVRRAFMRKSSWFNTIALGSIIALLLMRAWDLSGSVALATIVVAIFFYGWTFALTKKRGSPDWLIAGTIILDIAEMVTIFVFVNKALFFGFALAITAISILFDADGVETEV